MKARLLELETGVPPFPLCSNVVFCVNVILNGSDVLCDGMRFLICFLKKTAHDFVSTNLVSCTAISIGLYM
jgi:hypothetical protein